MGIMKLLSNVISFSFLYAMIFHYNLILTWVMLEGMIFGDKYTSNGRYLNLKDFKYRQKFTQ